MASPRHSATAVPNGRRHGSREFTVIRAFKSLMTARRCAISFPASGGRDGNAHFYADLIVWEWAAQYHFFFFFSRSFVSSEVSGADLTAISNTHLATFSASQVKACSLLAP